MLEMLDMALLQCSANVHPAIVNTIAKTESSFNPFAIGVNKGSSLKRQPQSYSEAVTVAKQLLKNGANIDMGLAQINSSNMQWLNLSVEQAFNPCSNLKAMQTVYLDCYSKAGNSGLGTRMQRAFSCYNTGGMTRGFNNGYVTKATNNYNTFARFNFNQAIPNPNNPPAQAPQLAQGRSVAIPNAVLEESGELIAEDYKPQSTNAFFDDGVGSAFNNLN